MLRARLPYMEPSDSTPSEPIAASKPAAKRKRPSQNTFTTTDPLLNAQASAHDESNEKAAEAHASTSTNFRNVSACNRCRGRKHRCDQKLPACSSCLKAGVSCVGYDPVSKREIPRSYVFYLESRVSSLESLLQAHDISYPVSGDLAIDLGTQLASTAEVATSKRTGDFDTGSAYDSDAEKIQADPRSTNSSKTAIQDYAGLNHRATKSPISFASIVYAAVRKSMSDVSHSGNGISRSSKSQVSGTGNTKDSFFGLYSAPTVEPAGLPDQEVAERLINLYFEHSNPQIPILHRGEFEFLLTRIYAAEPKDRSHRELFMLNIICAIGSGIIMDNSDYKSNAVGAVRTKQVSPDGPRNKRQRLSHKHYEPEEYHAAALVHLESFMYSPVAIESTGYGLEELQAVLLLAGFALLRPTTPGLWYIVGVAVRLAVDLGLHFEDSDIELERSAPPGTESNTEAGRRQWMRDMRRRLWYCTYSLDRLVAVCVGRPVSIPDTVITTEFPSLLDDKDITPQGFVQPSQSVGGTLISYKHVSHHYFRLRLLQSEILQVLQHRQAQMAVAASKTTGNPYILQGLPSPFLARFPSFAQWRADIDRRLWQWMQSAPPREITGVGFNPLFLELNYWQAVVMIYRHSLAVPAPLAGELDDSTGGEARDPTGPEDEEDEEMVFLKVAEAGQRVLRIYRQLHRMHLVNYTYLATHHLFVCGISFLYAIWHSVRVRSLLTIDDVDFTVLAATSVLSDLIAKCPPAQACRDAFKRMSKATVSMCLATTGFGEDAARFVAAQNVPESIDQEDYSMDNISPVIATMGSSRPAPQPRPHPHFDMGFKDLFSESDLALRSPVDETVHQLPTNRQRNPRLERSSTLRPSGRQPTSSYPQNPESTLDPSLRAGMSFTSSPAGMGVPEDPAYEFSSLDFFNPSTLPTGLDGDVDVSGFAPIGNAGLSGTNWEFGLGASGLGFDGGAGGSGWDNEGIDLLGGFYFGAAGGANGKAS